VPNSAPLGVLGLVGPTILSHGHPELQDKLLPRLFRGDAIACQLFSEPEAGSDLANVRTRAARDGDSWVINGQKVWSSGAHYADVGEIICRSEPATTRHKGLTAFVIDMRAPGVEVRPLRQITGGAHFNEVFLTDVAVDESARLGEVGGGWSVALATLLHERAAAGDDWYGSSTTRMAAPEWLAELARRRGLAGDPRIRQHLASLYTAFAVTRWWNARMSAGLAPGQLPGPEMSITKLSLARNMTQVAELAAMLLGPAIAADGGDWGAFSWSELLLGAPAMHIGGGTDEIMRSILAERVLGLPRDR
jgi:alkylation response protein AidB-like acyl-CoA dehydrogenase